MSEFNPKRQNFNPRELEFCYRGCDSEWLCLECAVQELRNSAAGAKLAENPPRYSTWTFEDPDRFKQFLGPDVDPLLHGPHQAMNVALPMIEMQNSLMHTRKFTEEEAKILFLAHVYHDAHEGIWGDIPLPDKTEDNNRKELELNLRVVSEILREDPESEFMRRYSEVVGDLQGITFLGRAFTAGEYCGYFLTGLRAWSLRDHSPLDEEERAKVTEMGREVVSHDIQTLQRYGHDFPFCEFLLNSNWQAVNEVRRREL